MTPEEHQVRIARLTRDVEAARTRANEAEAAIAVHVAKAEQAAQDYAAKVARARDLAAQAADDLTYFQGLLEAAQAEAEATPDFPAVDDLPSLGTVVAGGAANASIVTEEN